MATNSVSGVAIYVQGTTSDGGLKIYGNKKFKLVLNGTDITSTKGPAINDQCHKRVFVHLTEGTTNRLTDAATYSDDSFYISGASASTEDRKGCFFSEGNMIFSGSGVLVVNGKNRHGICTDGSFVLRPGTTIVVESAEKNGIHVKGDEDDAIGVLIKGGLIYESIACAAGKGIKCDSDITTTGGTLIINTSGNAVYSDEEKDTSSASCLKSDKNINLIAGTLTGVSTGQAGKGIKADGNIAIGDEKGNGPVISLTTSGSSYGSSSGSQPGGFGNFGGFGGPGTGSSSSASSKAKAMKAEGTITINGGDITISTAKDGAEGIESKTKSAESIVVNGGDIYLKCYDDAINSAGAIIFNGGRTYAISTGNDAVDSNYGQTGAVTINGGTLIAASSKGSPEEGIDADNATLKVTGGYLFTIGGAQSSTPSVPNSTTATQPTALLKSVSLTSGSYMTVFDSNGKTIWTIKMPFSFSKSYSLLSCPAFTKGSSYTFKSGTNAPTGYSDEFHDIYYGGTSTSSTSVKSINFSSNYVAL